MNEQPTVEPNQLSRCQRCQQVIPSQELVNLEGDILCYNCLKELCPTIPTRGAVETTSSVGYVGDVPWLRRHTIGWIRAFILTCWEIILRPKGFFSALTSSNDLVGAFWFGVICGILSIWLVVGIDWFINKGAGFDTALELVKGWLNQPIEKVQLLKLSILFAPFYSLLNLFVLTAALYLGYWIVNPGRTDKTDFDRVFQIAGYITLTDLLQIIPGLGDLGSWIYQMVLTFLGMRFTCALSKSQSMLVAMFPMMLRLTLLISLAGGGKIGG